MAAKVFIDGQEGTTGLRIHDRLKARDDIELIEIEPALRKSPEERKRLLNEADFAVLCLPDAAAIEAVSFVQNKTTRVIDASTAHRTHPGWAYGLPELSKAHRSKIASGMRVAVPGCYACGFNSIMYPIVQDKLIQPYHPLFCHAVSGYSGGGKGLIGVYEGEDKPAGFFSPMQYSMGRHHKHIKEMTAISELSYPPIFNPAVDDYYSGMVVTIPLHLRTLAKKTSAELICAMYAEHYKNQKVIKVMPFMGEGILENGFLAANTLKDSDSMQIFVFGNNDHALICARFDNLGKGASGSAVQCLNIMMGVEETVGLCLI
ncbi:MAG: N-acetyl-gamma-glutamyl-phosphate reductase [Oscillospiraceae bacterium]|nr:N-acetyl-gamma-glutamyl-phosphate reductase [Oscillospiraceae bacterium]